MGTILNHAISQSSHADSVGPRIAIFTHDTFGLGHVRRTSHIARRLAELLPNAAILLITGSPALDLFKGMPSTVDFVKIPTIVKTGTQENQPAHLPLTVQTLSHIRERVILETVGSFAPDIFLVDNFPLGSRRELLPTLQYLRTTTARTVLGLRDIVDLPEKVRADWQKQQVYEALDAYYDRILVYGLPETLDAAAAYDLPAHVARKLQYCGFITNVSSIRPATAVRSELGVTGPFVLATGGGGGDAFPLLRTFLDALPRATGLPGVVITGPLMNIIERGELRNAAARLPGIRVREFTDDLPSCMAAAEVVVSMGGYNTAAEIAAVRPRAVIMVPRTWRYGEHGDATEGVEEWEQLLRAQGMARNGMVDLLDPGSLNADRLAKRIRVALGSERQTKGKGSPLNGLDTAVELIIDLVPKGVADASK